MRAGRIVALFLGVLAVALTLWLLIIVAGELADEVIHLRAWSEVSLYFYASVLLAVSFTTGLSGSIFLREKKSPFLMGTSFLLSSVAFVYLYNRNLGFYYYGHFDPVKSLAVIVSSIFFVVMLVLAYENLVNKEADGTET